VTNSLLAALAYKKTMRIIVYLFVLFGISELYSHLNYPNFDVKIERYRHLF